MTGTSRPNNSTKADNHTHSKVTEKATTTVKQTEEGTVTTTVRTVEYA